MGEEPNGTVRESWPQPAAVESPEDSQSHMGTLPCSDSPQSGTTGPKASISVKTPAHQASAPYQGSGLDTAILPFLLCILEQFVFFLCHGKAGDFFGIRGGIVDWKVGFCAAARVL